MTDFFTTGLTTEQFLREYWQQKPLLIRQAFKQFQSPISPAELAGFACEDDVESRLIRFQPPHTWSLQQGSFDEDVFADLPDHNWTLLVQDMDKHMPALAEILDYFDFVPDWRLDDLMVSYAVKGGSVGPHTDSYDVFLLQAMGQREWSISAQAMPDVKCVPGSELSVIADFEVAQRWILEPGDMLYLPPHYAHHGIALDDCMTFSVGFRSPDVLEIMEAMLEEMFQPDGVKQHYTDAARPVNQQRYAMSEVDITAMKAFFQAKLDSQPQRFASAVCRLLTRPKAVVEVHAQDWLMASARDSSSATSQQQFRRNPYLRALWHIVSDEVQLFIAGEAYLLPLQAQELLASVLNKTVIEFDEYQQICNSAQSRACMEILEEAGLFTWK